eukprot:gene11418-23888_t
MVHQLENDYKVRNIQKIPRAVEHLLDTINALGGWKGIIILTVIIFTFYLYVLRIISQRHNLFQMEFENLGTHCEFDTCRQKDFLPFKCDACKFILCLEHRSYASHNCSATGAKDMTSVDCPVCGKGIKLSKADNPDLIWETHFQHECSQQPSSTKSQASKCPALGCRTTLGPSNTFRCPKCHKQVCLQHRTPEDHSCSALPTKKPSDNIKANKNINTQDTKLNTSSNTTTSHATKKINKTNDPQNSLYGTADRRKKTGTTNVIQSMNSTTEQNVNLECPICGMNFIDQEILVTHVNFEHNELASSNNDSATSSTSAYRPDNTAQRLHSNIGNE